MKSKLILICFAFMFGLFIISMVSAVAPAVNISSPGSVVDYGKEGMSLNLTFNITGYGGTIPNLWLRMVMGRSSGVQSSYGNFILIAPNGTTYYIFMGNSASPAYNTTDGNLLGVRWSSGSTGTPILSSTNLTALGIPIIAGGWTLSKVRFSSDDPSNTATLYNSSYSLDGVNYVNLSTSGTTTSSTFTNITLNRTVGNNCWYNYNGTNTSIGCDVNTTFTLADYSKRTLILYANNSAGEIGTATRSWEYNLFSTQQNYTPTTAEITANNYSINVIYNATQFTSISNNFVYNGVSYETTSTGDDGNKTFYATINTPSTTSDTNYTFYWQFLMTNATGTYTVNSDSTTQLVKNSLLDNCQTYTYMVMNFTNFDEDTGTRLMNNTFKFQVKIGDPAMANYILYSNISNISYGAVCLQNPLNGTYRMDLSIQYSSPSYVTRYYNVQNYQLNSSTMAQNITLYDLLTASLTGGATCTMNVRDVNYAPVSGALLRVEKQSLSTGNYIVTEIPATDSLGNVITNLGPQSSIYNMYVTKNGQTLQSFTNINSCPSALQFSGGSITPGTGQGTQGIYWTSAYNYNTRSYVLQWNSADGLSHTVKLNGTLYDGTTYAQVCSQEIPGLSGTNTCNVPIANVGNRVLMQWYVDGDYISNELISINASRAGTLTNMRYILAGFLLIFFVLIAGSSPQLALIFTGFGVLFASALYLIDTNSLIGASASIVWLLIAIGLVIWKLQRGGIQNG